LADEGMERDAAPAAHNGRRCRVCGDVIGVYEPVVVCDASPRTTSLAAEPTLDAGARCYHRLCFARPPGRSGA
jgi:hypothetical protein